MTQNSVNTGSLTTDGQVLIGSSVGLAAPNTLTQGSGITITNGHNTITIAASTTAFAWTTVSGTTQTIVANNGYVANNAGLITFTLPATAAVGDTFKIVGLGAGGWTIAQNSGQLVHLGAVVSTTGAGGSWSSTNQFDSVSVTCIVTNTTWSILEAVGNLTPV